MKALFGDITHEQFLAEYWQKKPLLIRQAWPDFEPIMAADELAGMSLEEQVESRIIIENGDSSAWQLLRGPFNEETFSQLPKDKWTMLIQGVDQWLPEAADILEHFSFIPRWRIDDLMISYAPDGGSVGPHYDQYDVFLLQASGTRRWSIGQMCSEASEFLTEPEIRVLAEFDQQESWLVEPGDLLYLPPRLAHWGVAEGDDCMTYSIGFRAPSESELLSELSQQLLLQCGEDARYSDPDLQLQNNSGEISRASIDKLAGALHKSASEPALLAQAIGSLGTQAKYPEQQKPAIEASDDEIWQEIKNSEQLSRDEMARFSFFLDDKSVMFFYGGQSVGLDLQCLPAIQLLANHRYVESAALLTEIKNIDPSGATSSAKSLKDLLILLYRKQYLYDPLA